MGLKITTAPSVCPECGGSLVWDPDSGEKACRECGLVLEATFLNTGPERRAFTQEETESRSRTGMPLSFSIHDKGLSTTIRVDMDARGKRIPPKTRLQMFRLRRWQINSSIDRNLAQALSELDKLADKLHIPPTVQETAAVIYRKALKRGLVRGRSISDVVTASLYAACRLTQTLRPLGEIASHSPIDKKDLARCYRRLLRELNLHMPVPNAQLRVPKIASMVGVGEKTQQMAVEILREADRLKATAGKDPMGLAAAALYIACVMNEEKRIQKMIAAAAGVTEVTIRNRYTELKKILDLDRYRPGGPGGYHES